MKNMYYEEKTIDGVLHYRSTPDGEFVAFDAATLTVLYLGAKVRAEGMDRVNKEYETRLNTIQSIVNERFIL
jgi:hypothetical protein